MDLVLIASLLVCALSIVSCQDPPLLEGECPLPPIDGKFSDSQLQGTWYDVSTDYVLAKKGENKRLCPKDEIEVTSEGFLLVNMSWVDPKGNSKSLRKRFIPVEGQNGVYNTQNPNSDGDDWEDFVWRYSFIKRNDKCFLEFACREYTSHHREFNRIRCKTPQVDEKTLADFKNNAYESVEEWLEYDHSNCNHDQS